jgi:hypothetical protein
VISPIVKEPPLIAVLSFFTVSGNDNFLIDVELLLLELELELLLPQAVNVTARTEANVTSPAIVAFFIYISSSAIP